MRALPQAVLDKLDEDHIPWTFLAKLDFEGAPLRIWGGAGALSYDGHTWLGIASENIVAGIEPLKETIGTDDPRTRAVLSLVDSDLIDDFETLRSVGRDFEFRIVLLDDSSNPVGEIPFAQIMGALDYDQEETDEGIVETATLELLSYASLLRRSFVRRLTHEDQLLIDPNDHSLEFIADPDMEKIDMGERTRIRVPGGAGLGNRNRLLDE